MNIDVILVSYNQCRYIQQALESIFIQVIDAHVKVIVADDASNDGTMALIQEHVARSPFETLVLQSSVNLGISRNYQRAFNACDGDYIAILEGDDYWCSPYHLRQHVAFLEEHRECSMSMNCYIRQEDSTNMFTKERRRYPRFPHFVNVREQIEQGNQLGNLSACVLRASCVKRLPVELFDLPIADWMLGIMLSQQGFLAVLETPTSVYRTNSNSQWASKSKEEQLEIVLSRADEYDAFQGGRYHAFWDYFKRSLQQRDRIRIKDCLPPFVLSIARYCIPPVLLKKIKNNGAK